MPKGYSGRVVKARQVMNPHTCYGGFLQKVIMAEEKEVKKGKKKAQVNPNYYKSYDIKWLRSVKEDHPDGYLVDEYDRKKKK